jgi:SHS2 domain-containing protein
MVAAHEGRYELLGRGADLAIKVTGEDLRSCLQAAVEGFAAAVGQVASTAPRRRQAIHIEGDSPDELLVNLLDEAILRLDADGALAVGLTDVTVGADGLRGRLELVDLAKVEVHGDPPKAATWHDASLERSGDAWRGQVMLDL